MAELVDALDLGSSGATRGSSSLPIRTKGIHTFRRWLLHFFQNIIHTSIIQLLKRIMFMQTSTYGIEKTGVRRVLLLTMLIIFSALLPGQLLYARSGDEQPTLEKFRQAANQGSAEAQFYMGKYFYRQARHHSQKQRRKDYKKALAWFEKAAKQGHAAAQNKLAIMYYEGRGTESSFPKARKWEKKSASQGFAPAQRNIGLAYDDGLGEVKKKPGLAAHWYRKAAKQNDAAAQYHLGLMYYLGEGVPKKEQKAFSLMQKAARQNYKGAQKYLAIMYSLGQGVEKNLQKARYWRTKANNNNGSTPDSNSSS